MRRLALVAAVLVGLAGCGDKKDSSVSSASAPVKATTRVEVIESQGEGGFDAQKIYKAEAPGVVTVVSDTGQLTACLTSLVIFASSALLSFVVSA